LRILHKQFSRIRHILGTPRWINNNVIQAFIIGLAGFLLSFSLLHMRGYQAGDFQWAIRGGQALLDGENPYLAISPAPIYPLGTPFFYPLPAAVVGFVFIFMDSYLAGALFFGLSTTLLAYGILKNGERWRLLLFLSPSFVVASYVAQWSPLLLAGAFIPIMQIFMVCKPTIGLASFLYRPSKVGIGLAVLAGLLSLIIMPDWPFWFIGASRNQLIRHLIPLIIMPFLLLGFLSIRSREGRVFSIMTLIPQSIFFYDQLYLWLIPKSKQQMVFLTISSWVSFGIWAAVYVWKPMEVHVISALPYIIVGFFVPALMIFRWHLVQKIYCFVMSGQYRKLFSKTKRRE